MPPDPVHPSAELAGVDLGIPRFFQSKKSRPLQDRSLGSPPAMLAAPGAAGDGGARAQRAGRLAHPCRPPGGRGSSGRPRQAPQRVGPTSSGRTAPSRALEACCSAWLMGWGASRGWSVRCAAWSAPAVRIGLTHRPWPQETGETASSDDNAALQFRTKPCLPHEYPVGATAPSGVSSISTSASSPAPVPPGGASMGTKSSRKAGRHLPRA